MTRFSVYWADGRQRMSSIQFAYNDPDRSAQLSRPLIFLIILGMIYCGVVSWLAGMSYLYLGLYALPLIPLMLLNIRITLYVFIFSFTFSVTLVEYNAAIHFRADDFLFPLLYIVWFFDRALNPQKKLSEKQFALPIILFLAVTAVTTVYSTVGYGTGFVFRAGYYFIKLVQYSSLYFIVNDLIDSHRIRQILMRLIFLSTVIITFYGFFEYHVLGYHVATGPLSDNHSHIGAYLAFMIFVFGGYALSTKNIPEKLLCLGMIPVMFYVLIISASRAGILAAIAAFGILLVFTKRPFFILIAGIFGAFAVTFGLDYLMQLQEAGVSKAQFQDMEADLSFMGRVLIWLSAWNMFRSDPSILITGVGLGNFFHGTMPYMVLKSSATGAHNNYIHVLAEAGVFGLLSWFYIFFAMLRKSLAKFRDKLNSERYLFYGYFCGLCALLITCLTQETFSVQTALSNFLGFFFVFTAILFYQKPD